MVDADRYCIDLMHQLAAVQFGAATSGSASGRSKELIAVVGRYRRTRGQSP